MDTYTRLPSLDSIIGEFHPGTLVLICGRPSSGKTTFLLNILAKATERSAPVIYFSQEMSKSYIQRRLATISRYDLELVVDDTPNVSVQYISKQIKNIKHRQGTVLIGIDYLQLMQPENLSNKYEMSDQRWELSEICGDLSRLAKEENICILLASGLWRNVEERIGHCPNLSDLKLIGEEVEYYADVVILMTYPYTFELLPDDKIVPQSIQLTAVTAKNRNGALADYTLTVDYQSGRILEICPIQMAA